MSLLIALDGAWRFAYQPALESTSGHDEPEPPAPSEFAATMPVPGYWDDHLDRVRMLPAWRSPNYYAHANPIVFPAGPGLGDAELPYLMGAGWYRRGFVAAKEWSDRVVTLHVGGVAMEAWVWLNGQFVGHRRGHSTPFELALEAHVKAGAENEILIAVANTRTDQDGCSIRGYAGQSGGISRPVSLRVAGAVAIGSLYLYPQSGGEELQWNLALVGYDSQIPGECRCEWSIAEPHCGTILGQGETHSSGSSMQWTTASFGMQPWSDRLPVLYEIRVRVFQNDVLQDEIVQPFGLRRFGRDGTLLKLNDTPIYLRGATESHYFPDTCTAPICKATYRENLRRLKSLGFNWLRFHTWTPNEEYLDAADELGMLMQVEPPFGADSMEWLDILRSCRRHPSVVIYCGGNEELLDEANIVRLRKMQEVLRAEVPDALFSPMAALRGVEYHYTASNLGTDPEPWPAAPEQSVNRRRMRLLQEFSDVFESLYYNMEYGWPMANILWKNLTDSVRGDWRGLGGLWKWMESDHPHLLHELAILGTYLDLDLEHRYEGTRIGPDLYAATRRHLREEGVLPRAPLYFRNSCAVAALWRKYHLELTRRCPQAQGYDLLGAIDFHWHRTGYPCGLLNEFYELKPGATPQQVLQYNADSVLLLDHTTRRNFYCGDRFDLELLVSHYGVDPMLSAKVDWHLKDESGFLHHRGTLSAANVPLGAVTSLGVVEFTMPRLDRAAKVTLRVRLSSENLELANEWDFWVFPQQEPVPVVAAADAATRDKLQRRYPQLAGLQEAPAAPLRLVSELDDATAEFLVNGGRVVLLRPDPHPEVEHTMRPMSAGRPFGDAATVVADHPLFRSFPHDGYCAWQFYTLLHHANPHPFNGVNLPFDPILEVASSYKRVRRQALLFEYRVGRGRLLGCALSWHWDDPATCYLADAVLAYAAGDEFKPRHVAGVEALRQLTGHHRRDVPVFQSDNAFDFNALSATQET